MQDSINNNCMPTRNTPNMQNFLDKTWRGLTSDSLHSTRLHMANITRLIEGKPLSQPTLPCVRSAGVKTRFDKVQMGAHTRPSYSAKDADLGIHLVLKVTKRRIEDKTQIKQSKANKADAFSTVPSVMSLCTP